MQEIIVDEGKIKCLISGKYRRETPEEYVRQEFCRILLDVYKYPKSHIEVEYPIKVGSTDKRCDIVVFCDDDKSQDNILWIIETKKKDEKEGVEQLWSYMSATTAVFGTWTNGDGIMYYHKDSSKSNRYMELPDIPKYKESVDSIGKYQKNDLVRCTDLKGVFKRCNNYFFSNQGLTQDKRFSEILKILFCKIEDEKDLIGIIGQFHLHFMVNSAVDPAALFLFENISQSLQRGFAFIAPFGLLGVFGNVPGLARQKSARDTACRAVVADAALGGIPKRRCLFYG